MKKKTLKAIFIASAITALSCITVFAAGWKSDSNGWWYATNDSGTEWYSNGWQWVDGNNDGIAECYYFEPSGYITMNGTTADGYQVNADGAWIVDGVVQTKIITNVTANVIPASTDVTVQNGIMTIELKPENFTNYFEIGKSCRVYGTVFDEVDASYYQYFILKPEYREKFIASKDYISSFSIEWQSIDGVLECKLDPVNNTYTYLGTKESFPGNRIDKDSYTISKADDKLHVTGGYVMAKEDAQGFLVGSGVGTEFDKILRVEGKLYLYE